MSYINVTPKQKPKWHEVRRRIARVFVRIAQKIYPNSPEVMAFHMQQMTDMMILGHCITRIDPMKYNHVEGGES
jgi:hypothetical protein